MNKRDLTLVEGLLGILALGVILWGASRFHSTTQKVDLTVHQDSSSAPGAHLEVSGNGSVSVSRAINGPCFQDDGSPGECGEQLWALVMYAEEGPYLEITSIAPMSTEHECRKYQSVISAGLAPEKRNLIDCQDIMRLRYGPELPQ
jgi:hypothetical protein